MVRAQEVERKQLERAERRADVQGAAVRAVIDERDALERRVGRLAGQLIATDAVK